VIRTVTIVFALTLSAAAPALSFSPAELDSRERDAMLSTCRQLPGSDGSMCRDVVNDANMSANSKRSCLHAMKAMLQGSRWEAVKSLPEATTCRSSLARGGYPVGSIAQRLNGVQASTR